MITRKLIALLAAVIVVCIAASGLVGWGVASATLAGADSKTIAGAAGVKGADGADGTSGSNGEDGADGRDGSAGANGTDGSNGATGATGATGAPGSQGPAGIAGAPGAQGNPGIQGPKGDTGDQGIQGPKGDQGDAGAPGASAPSFSVTSASGQPDFSLFPNEKFGPPIGVPVQIPAGPALVGFTLTITDMFIDNVTCSLVEANSQAIIVSAATTLVTPSGNTVSTTQVVTLGAATTLQLECAGFSDAFSNDYDGLSVYAVSFATT